MSFSDGQRFKHDGFPLGKKVNGFYGEQNIENAYKSFKT